MIIDRLPIIIEGGRLFLRKVGSTSGPVPSRPGRRFIMEAARCGARALLPWVTIAFVLRRI
jgi:hypothetical protein